MDAVQINEYFKSKKYGKVKRQKLLYYAQGRHLAWYGRPLFDDDLEAWPLGPVAPQVQEADNARLSFPFPTCRSVLMHLEAIDRYYGMYSGSALAERSHKESPWRNACSRATIFVRRPTISHEDMMRFFSLPGNWGPTRPAVPAKEPSRADFLRVLDGSSDYMSGIDQILANR